MIEKSSTSVMKTIVSINNLCNVIFEEKCIKNQPVVSLTSSVLLEKYENLEQFINEKVDIKPYHLMSVVLHDRKEMINFLMAYDKNLAYKIDEYGVNTVDFARHLVENLPFDNTHYQGAKHFLQILENKPLNTHNAHRKIGKIK